MIHKPLSCLVLLALAAAPAAAQRPPVPEPEKPSAEAIAAFVRDLKDAARSDPTDIRDLLTRALWMDDRSVAREVGRYVEHKDATLRAAAVRALRYHRNEKALDVLIRAVNRKPVMKDQETLIAVILAIGQHGDEKGVSALVENAYRLRNNKVLQARATALAHIRHGSAVDAAVRLLRATGRRGGRRGGRGGDPERAGQPRGLYLTLFLLTGERLESDPQVWKKWWERNRRGYRVSQEPRRLTERQERQWRRTWERPRRQGRGDRDAEERRRPRRGAGDPGTART